MLSMLPGLHTVTPAMIDRMEQDLCFDHSKATSDFSYTPRGFLETTFYNQHIPANRKIEKKTPREGVIKWEEVNVEC